jgi:hypothetical protein
MRATTKRERPGQCGRKAVAGKRGEDLAAPLQPRRIVEPGTGYRRPEAGVGDAANRKRETGGSSPRARETRDARCNDAKWR